MKLRKFDLTVMTACLALLGFLGWHGLYGPRNFTHRDKLLAEAALLISERDSLARDRETLDVRVALMRPDSVDPDLLDELSRRYLNYVKTNELILIRK